MHVIEYGQAHDRLNELYERLRTASREESPGLRQEIEEARRASRKELDDLEHLAKQVVVRRAEIKTALVHHLAEIERQCERIPGLPPEQLVTEMADLRQRCDKLRSLVEELR